MRGLDRPPVIIGHSFGGLVAELLLDRGLGAAGVAISPAQVAGRPHFAGASGWEAVADYALDWAERRAAASAPSS